MKEQLTNFETAKLAKEIGFDWEVTNYFKLTTISNPVIEDTCNLQNINNVSDTVISRPTQSILQRWLRDEYDIQMILKPFYDGKEHKRTFVCDVIEIKRTGRTKKSHRQDTYEEALEEGLLNGLNLIKELKDN